MKSQVVVILFFLLYSVTQAQITITEVSTIPESVSNNAVCEGFINDTAYIFSFGGIDSSKVYSGIHLRSYRYNIQSQVTEQIADLPDTMGKIAAAASRIGDIIYVAGGYHVFQNGSEISSSRMHRYDILNNKFLNDAKDIPIPIDDHVQAVWKDSLIYIITGWSNAGNVPNVQIYNPISDTWLTGTSVPNNNNYKSFGASGTIVNDTIYYFGGASSGSGFPIQNQLRKGAINPSDPTKITWSASTPDAGIDGYRMACTTAEDKIYWIGGSNLTYNFNGIAYNGSGGVPTSKRVLYTKSNTILWNKIFLDEVPMDLRGIASIDDTTKYILGGMLSDQLVSNKVFKLKLTDLYSSTASYSENSMIDDVRIYPNPIGDILHVDLGTSVSANITLFDGLGRQLFSQILTVNNNSVNVKFLPNGLYFVQIRTEKSIYLKKLVK